MNWSDITLEQLVDIENAKQSDCSAIEKRMRIYSAVYRCSMEDARKVSLKRLYDFHNELAWMNQLPKEVITKKVKIDGRVFEFELDAQKLDAGSYITIMDVLKRAKEEGVLNYIHKILAEMATEKGKKADADVAELFYKNLTVDVAYPIGVFFWKLSNALMQRILPYLASQMEMKVSELEDLLSNGDGLSHSTTSQIQTLLSGIRSQNGELFDSLTRLLTSSRSKTS